MSARAFRVWLWPSLIAVASVFGLLSALLGTGVWHVLSWIALGGPLVVVSIAMKRGERSRVRSDRDLDRSAR